MGLVASVRFKFDRRTLRPFQALKAENSINGKIGCAVPEHESCRLGQGSSSLCDSGRVPLQCGYK